MASDVVSGTGVTKRGVIRYVGGFVIRSPIISAFGLSCRDPYLVCGPGVREGHPVADRKRYY